MVHHGWLTRIAPGAALDGRMRMVANVRRRFARANRFTTTAGLRQPLLVRDAGPLKNGDIRGARTHVHESGDRQPAVVRKRVALAGHSEQCSANTDCSIKSGRREPAVVRQSRQQTPGVCCRTRMLACHGRLTSAALGDPAVRTFADETATCAIHERSFTRAAGVSPPWCAKPTPRREDRALFSN
jgi:hypothetical protein